MQICILIPRDILKLSEEWGKFSMGWGQIYPLSQVIGMSKTQFYPFLPIFPFFPPISPFCTLFSPFRFFFWGGGAQIPNTHSARSGFGPDTDRYVYFLWVSIMFYSSAHYQSLNKKNTKAITNHKRPDPWHRKPWIRIHIDII